MRRLESTKWSVANECGVEGGERIVESGGWRADRGEWSAENGEWMECRVEFFLVVCSARPVVCDAFN